jgi:short-subunit dehydrogenase
MSPESSPASESATPEREGRTALVTGASSGIGHAFAERLAADGYRLILVARRADRLEAMAKSFGERFGPGFEVFPADLNRSEELRAVEDRIASEPTLELVVNNAGFGTVGCFADLDPDGEEAEIRLNVLALVRLARAGLPGMIERGRGAVVNVSSMAGFSPSPYMATYAATKAFVTTFTEGLAGELEGTGVKVQALCPGFTRTEFQQVAGANTEMLPSFAWQEPDEVVEASLAGLARGDLVVVPGRANQAVAALSSALPRSWTRRLLGAAMKRSLPEGE